MFKKLKRIVGYWILFTFITFFLYDVMWIFIDFKNFKQSVLDIDEELIIDLFYCAVFSLTSLLISIAFIDRNDFSVKRESFRHPWHLWAVVLTLNILIAFVCETLSNIFIYTDSSRDAIISSAYNLCLISSLLSFIMSSQYYCRLIIRQNDERTAMQKLILKSQLDPHFVINCLDSLAYLVKADGNRAEKYIIAMSRLYRGLVENLAQNTVSVADAMGVAKNYVALFDLRYPGTISLETDDFSGCDNEKVLASSLLLLIENAIKHNVASRDELLIIEIRRDCDGYLAVRNNIIEKERPALYSSFNVGLKNLCERYRLECGIEPVVQKHDGMFEVKLPILYDAYEKNLDNRRQCSQL